MQVCDRMPKADMLCGMLSYLLGGGYLLTQVQANEVGGWEKCGEHCQVSVTQAEADEVGGWENCRGSLGRRRGCPRGASLLSYRPARGERPPL